MKSMIRYCLAAVAALVVSGSGASEWDAPIAGSLDGEFLRINAEMPGFGGFYFVDDVPHVMVTDLKASIDPAILGEYVQERALKAGLVSVQGNYDFAELHRWRSQLRKLLSHPDVVWLDIDETTNQVSIGVDRAASKSSGNALAIKVRKFGIPGDAVNITRADPILPLVTLRDAFDPVPGGVEINFPGFLCTLGFNVRFSAGGPCYFMTNDHCTSVQGTVTGTPYLQPAGGAQIGVEVWDPAYFTGGVCPAGSQCRYSDSAAGRYDDPAMCEFGSIARTTGLGSITIDNAAPRWTIVSKQEAPAVGQLMAKTGRTTGWSEGNVFATCVDTGVAGSNNVQLCQTHVAATVGGGDSGSPVFRRRLDSSRAQLAGILWGGNGAGTQFVFSPIANIEIDAGGRVLPVF